MRQFLKITTTFALALVFTAGMAFGQDSDATLDQLGDDNNATIQQNGGDGEMQATALQDGDQNALDLTQSDFGEADHAADIRQVGFSNDADLQSQGGVGANFLDVDQVGNNNETTVAHFSGSHYNKVLQNGNRNDAEIAHRSSFDNSVTLVQRGDDNSVLATDDGQGANGAEKSTFEARQIGDQNEGTLTHTGGNLEAYLTQDGFSNEASITQNTGTEVFDNYADVVQRGNNNMSTVTQGTDGNFADVRQIGNRNTSTVTQE